MVSLRYLSVAFIVALCVPLIVKFQGAHRDAELRPSVAAVSSSHSKPQSEEPRKPDHSLSGGGGLSEPRPLFAKQSQAAEDVSPQRGGPSEIIMDPNAPESWVDEFNPDVSDAGVSMDPNDPETWLDDFSPSDSDAGVTMDPNDPETWVESKRYDIDDGGILLDPNDPSTWEQLGGDRRPFDSGPVMDPNLPDSW